MRISHPSDRVARRVRLCLLVAGVAVTVALFSADGSAHLGVAGVTWNGTVSRILERHCVECHSVGGGALPQLDDYDTARAAVQAVKRAVLTRRMPRWHAVSGAGDFANDPSLTAYEIGLLAEWADEGAPRGDAVSPPASHTARPEMPAPDLVLRVSAKHVIKNAVDTFELNSGLTDTRWIRGWAFQPGNRARVRSAVISLASGATLGTWVPGESATFLPDGVAVRLPADSTIRLTIYYSQSHGPAVDASALGLYFAAPPDQEIAGLRLPCGTTQLTQSIDALAIRPAIDSSGASLHVVARRPDRSVEPLGWFQDYSSDYPQTYWYRAHVALPRGTSIEVSAAHGECSAELEYVVPGPGVPRLVASHDTAVRHHALAISTHAAPALDASTSGYACPMHPDVRTERPGTCPVCQMTLLSIGPRLEGAYALDARVSTGERPDQRTLWLVVRDPAGHGVVRNFEKVHERPFHLFVVSEDLQEFSHVHPTSQPDGSLTLTPAPIKSGAYRVYADFLPVGGTPQLIQKSIVTGLEDGVAASRVAYVAPDLQDKSDHGLRVAIDIETGALVAGTPTLIDFILSDPATGKPVSDLEPYLGAWGHMFIVSADLSDAVHSHPITLLTGPGGPRIVFNQRFPRPGSYRLWAQFQRGGQLSTVSFTVAVN